MVIPQRRRLVAVGIASAAVATAVGTTVFMTHGSAATAGLQVPTQAVAASPSPVASPSGSPRSGKSAHHATSALVGKVQSVSASSLSVVDAKGVVHTLAVGGKTTVTGPDGIEAVTSIPAGELVVVEVIATHAKAAASASPSGGTASGNALMIATTIKDSGFKAA